MSQRHRTEDSLVPLKKEVRAHAHSERHRIHVELQSVAQDVSSGLEPEDVHEPGAAWKPMHHRDAEAAKRKLAKQHRVKRHWKTKMWKRRTQLRRARAEQMRLAGEAGSVAGF
jgi:DNA segregation ATPase FtsK/SpoIIIE-like protein